MVQACQLVHHVHEVIPGKASIIGTNFLHKLNFINHVANCSLNNIVCACKGLMGVPAADGEGAVGARGSNQGWEGGGTSRGGEGEGVGEGRAKAGGGMVGQQGPCSSHFLHTCALCQDGPGTKRKCEKTTACVSEAQGLERGMEPVECRLQNMLDVQNEVHALLFCQDHRVCELRKHLSFLLTPFFEDFLAAQPFLLQQVNNRLVHGFLSQQNNRLFLFLFELMDLFVAGRGQSAADQPKNLAEGHLPL